MENREHNAAVIPAEDRGHNAANSPPCDIIINCETEYKGYKYNEKVDIYSLITLKAPCQVESDDTRAPIDLVFVIDRSGSMAGQKLELVKKTLDFVLTQLTEKDRLAVVSYDDKICLDFGLRNMTKDNKQFATNKIQSIREGGMTNLCGGLIKGMCQMIDRTSFNEVASVLLFTDGLANKGITNVNGIVAAMKDPKRFDGPSQESVQAARAPIMNRTQAPRHQSWLNNIFGGSNRNTPQEPTVSPPPPQVSEVASSVQSSDSKKNEASVYTFGFGSDHDPEMLKQISDAGNGMYYFIENEDKIAESFAHCLGGLMSTVAQGIQLSIALTEGVQIKKVHTLKPYENTSPRSLKVNIGDLQSEEKRDIVLELSADPVPQPYSVTPQKLLDARSDYFNVLSNDLTTAEGQLSVLRPEEVEIPAIVENPSRDVRKQKSRIRLANVVKNATVSADSGNYEIAKEELKTEMARLRVESEELHAIDESDDFYDCMYEDVNQCADAMESSQVYRSKGAKLQRNMEQQYCMQRSSNLDSKGFITGAKKKKQAAAKSFMKK